MNDLHSGVQSAHSRARVVLFLLAVALILDVIAIFSDLSQHSLLASVRDGAEITTDQADANDGRQQLIGIVQVLVFVATGIAWLMWQHRAYANLRLVGTRKTDLTPGWSVGYWFIPFVNLVRPYMTTRELWRRSELENAREPHVGQSSSIVGAWWLAYLATGFAGRAFATMIKSATTPEQMVTATNMSIVGDVLGVISALLAISLVRTIDRFQQEFPAAVQAPAIHGH